MKKRCCAWPVLIAALVSPLTQAASNNFATQWITANQVHLRYQMQGKGADVVVLLHENGMSLESWDYVAPVLAKNHRVLRYDLRGYGLSEKIRGAVTMDDELNDLRALLSALDIRNQVTLVGGAVGGAIALQFAATYPAQVKRVVAISPAAYLAGQMAPPASSSAPPSGSAANAPAAAAPDLPEASYPAAMREHDPIRYERFQAMQSAGDAASAQATIRMLYAIRFAEVLPAVQCPTVVVATSKWIRPVAAYKELADAIPNAQFEVLDTGHFAAMASPEMVTALLKKYLK